MSGGMAMDRRTEYRRAALILFIFLVFLNGRGNASEIFYSDFYDFAMKKFYVEKITLDGDALRIQAVSLDPKVKDFEFVINGEASPDGRVKLPGTLEAKPYHFHAALKPKGSAAAETVEFTFYPAKLYEKKGRLTEANYIIIHRATVATHQPSYVYRAPSYSPQDLAFAQKTWGPLKAAHASDIALAQAIERELLLALEKHRGIPSDAMDKSTPRTQYERALSGRDRVWCGNIAAIFQYACVGLGVEARVIFTGSDPQPVANRMKFLYVENHATVEVYSRENEAWFWVDPTGYVLEAKIGGAPITLLQAVEALGTPLEPKIQITTFDAAKKQSFILPLSESPAAAFMKNYFRPGVRLKF